MLERLIAIGVVAAILFGIASALKEHNDPQQASQAPPAPTPAPANPVAKQPGADAQPPPAPWPTHGKHDGKKKAEPLLPGLLSPFSGQGGD